MVRDFCITKHKPVDYSKIREIAPGILHDIGNAVTALNLNLEMLKVEGNTEQEFLERSLLSANEIAMLLSDYHYEVNNFDATKIFATDKIIKNTCKMFEQQFNKLNISLSTNINQARLKGSENKFSRIVFNLVVNAIEAVVKARKFGRMIEVQSFRKQKFYMLIISDNGVGIAKQDLEKIFQVGFSSRSNNSLSGLGLHIVRQAIESFGGDINVCSKKNIGTKFIVSIPISPKQ
jgi:signal transduction histidine kinase